MICQKCNQIIPEASDYCPFCGSKVVSEPHLMYCKSCGKIISPDSKFCPFCGEKNNCGSNLKAASCAYSQQHLNKRSGIIILVICIISFLACTYLFSIVLPGENYIHWIIYAISLSILLTVLSGLIVQHLKSRLTPAFGYSALALFLALAVASSSLLLYHDIKIEKYGICDETLHYELAIKNTGLFSMYMDGERIFDGHSFSLHDGTIIRVEHVIPQILGGGPDTSISIKVGKDTIKNGYFYTDDNIDLDIYFESVSFWDVILN